MTTPSHKTSCTNLVRRNLHCIGYGTLICLQYGWDWFVLSCSTKQDISTRKISCAKNSKGPCHSCSCCKHNVHWQVKTLWLVTYIYAQDALVVANELCVVVCKPNGMDDMKCIWKFRWWASMYFFKSEKQKVFLIMDKIPLSMLVGMNQLVFQTCNCGIYIYIYIDIY